MGTRADFYLGRGDKLEWIGSCAWDGHEDTMTKLGVLSAESEKDYLDAVDKRLSKDDGTRPKDGWPWPWETSHTTDRAYTFDAGKAWVSAGRQWQTRAEYEAREKEWARRDKAGEDEMPALPREVFPNMKDRQAVTLGKRSGILVFGVK